MDWNVKPHQWNVILIKLVNKQDCSNCYRQIVIGNAKQNQSDTRRKANKSNKFQHKLIW